MYKRVLITFFVVTLASQLLTMNVAFAKEKKEEKKVVVFSLPRVTWSRLEQVNTPNIDSLISQGSVAAMSVKTLGKRTTPEMAYSTLSAGGRTNIRGTSFTTFLEPSEILESRKAKNVFVDQRGKINAKNPAAVAIDFEAAVKANSRNLYGSKIGLLADTLYKHDKSIAAIGNADKCMTDSPACFDRAIGFFATDSNGVLRQGNVSRSLLNDSQITQLGTDSVVKQSKENLKKDDVVIVECSDLERVEASRTRMTKKVYDQEFSNALRSCDSLIGKIMKSISLSNDQVYVISPTAPKELEQTTIFISAGKDIPKGYALSSTTRRTGFVTLVDVAPSILSFYNIEIPARMSDTVITYKKSDSSVEHRKEFLNKLNEQTVIRDKSVVPVTYMLVFFILAGVALAVLSKYKGKRFKKLSIYSCLIAACLPTLAFLIRPFTLTLGSAFAITIALLVVATALSHFLYMLSRKHGVIKIILIIVSTNLIVQFLDILFGGNLQFNTVFGYSPVIAGRFAGYGNQAFGIVSASAIVFVAMIKQITSTREVDQHKVNRLLIAFLIAVLVIDGAPYFGSDVGGVLALTPTIFVAGMLLYDKKLGIKSFIAASFITLGALLIFAFIDLARPESKQTHLGRFVKSFLDGRAGLVIERKLIANLNIFTSSIWYVLILGVVIYVTVLFFKPETAFYKLNEKYVGFKFIVYPSLVAGILGMLLNDSGVAIPAIMLAVIVPALTLLVLEAEDIKV